MTLLRPVTKEEEKKAKAFVISVSAMLLLVIGFPYFSGPEETKKQPAPKQAVEQNAPTEAKALVDNGGTEL